MGGITGRFEIVKSTMDIPNHCTYTCPFDFDWNPSGSGTIHFEPNVDGYSVYTGYINTNCQGDQDWCQQWHGEGTLTLTNGTMYHGQFLRKSTDRNSPLRDGIYAYDDAIFQSMLPVKYDKLRFISMFVEVHRKRLLHKLSVPFVGVFTLPSGETRVGEFRLVCPFMRKVVSGVFGSREQNNFVRNNYWGYTRHLRDPESEPRGVFKLWTIEKYGRHKYQQTCERWVLGQFLLLLDQLKTNSTTPSRVIDGQII